MKRTYQAKITRTETLEEELPPGRFLAPGETIQEGDLCCPENRKSFKTAYAGEKVSKEAYYRPDPPPSDAEVLGRALRSAWNSPWFCKKEAEALGNKAIELVGEPSKKLGRLEAFQDTIRAYNKMNVERPSSVDVRASDIIEWIEDQICD